MDPHWGDLKGVNVHDYMDRKEKAFIHLFRMIYEKVEAEPRAKKLMDKLSVNVPPDVALQWARDKAELKESDMADPDPVKLAPEATQVTAETFLENLMTQEALERNGRVTSESGFEQTG